MKCNRKCLKTLFASLLGNGIFNEASGLKVPIIGTDNYPHLTQDAEFHEDRAEYCQLIELAQALG